MALAFSTWTPSITPSAKPQSTPWRHTHQSSRQCSRQAAHPPSRFSAVHDTSLNSNSNRGTNHQNPHLPESRESIHDRLGSHDVWHSSPATDTNSIHQYQQQQHQSTPQNSSADNESTDPNSVDIQISTQHPASESLSTHHIPVVNDPTEPPSPIPKPWDTTTGAHEISLLGRRVHFIRKRQKLILRSYEECRRITALFSKTFYLGTTLLSPDKRRAVWAIYTWCRRTDDLVDGPRVNQRTSELHLALEKWELRLNDIFKGIGCDALDLALVDVISNYPDLTPEPFLDMIKGMIMDVDQSRFETFDDLYLYCYRVAGTVGLMTLPIMGTQKPGRDALREAAEPALALGMGLQLTNILRDVGEDRLRGRIYLPLEDLRRFNYTEQDLFNCVLDNRYRNLMKFQIARARRYFRQAQRGVHLLADDSQLPVQASLDMYSQILDVLEENGYDNFNRRAYISKSKKLFTLPFSMMRTQQSETWRNILSMAETITGTRTHF